MTYQEFKRQIVLTISNKLGADFKVSLQDIIKNNDTHLDGLTILSKGSNISPTIYLNYYYEQYLSGKSLSKIRDDILLSYHKNVPKKNVDISFFTDFNQVKNRIIFKLVNYDRNRELLRNVPHIRYLDLAIIFNCYINSTEDGCATILIHHHHLSFWNIQADELYRIALKNTPELLQYQLQNMSDVIRNLFFKDQPLPPIDSVPELPMYVLSNITKLNGSGCILYEDLLSDIAEILNSDFYILPSSIHEVLLIPVESASSAEDLSSMVKEINDTQLSREEILSDKVYFYSRSTGTITM